MLHLTTPTTPLPNDPSSLSAFIRQKHLDALTALYELKSKQHLETQGKEATKRKQVRDGIVPEEEEDAAAPTANGGPGVEGDSMVIDGDETNLIKSGKATTTQEVTPFEDDEKLILETLGLLSNPNLNPHPTSNSNSQSKPEEPNADVVNSIAIDRQAHAYDFLFSLSPHGSSDTYYHGTHSLPHSNLVKDILRATKRSSALFDPNGLSSQQLIRPAHKLWNATLNPASLVPPSTTTTTPSTQTEGTTSTASIEELESRLIAQFSSVCDQRIGQRLASIESPLEREDYLQRRDDERYWLMVDRQEREKEMQRSIPAVE